MTNNEKDLDKKDVSASLTDAAPASADRLPDAGAQPDATPVREPDETPTDRLPPDGKSTETAEEAADVPVRPSLLDIADAPDPDTVPGQTSLLDDTDAPAAAPADEPPAPPAGGEGKEADKEEDDDIETGAPEVETVIRWIEEQQWGTLHRELSRLEGADIAELFAHLPEADQTRVYRLLPKELAAEAFAEMEPDMQQQLIRGFTDRELHDVLSEMYLDDTVDMIEEMPAFVVKRILAQSTPENRRSINELLKYDPDSAGGIMTPEYMRLYGHMTVEQAFAAIRRQAYDKESVYTCYVTDNNRHLIGVIDVKALLLASPDAKVSDLMNPDVIFVRTGAGREEVAHLFEKYNFIALPVTDAEERLVGIITFDDAMDVIHEETEEDFAKMNAMAPSDTPYLKTGVFRVWRNRIPWLLLLMVTATFTGMIISSFESALAASLALTAFIPMLMDTGGNSGSQASVTIIRGLSLGEVEPRQILTVLWKELRVAILCGLTLSVITFGKLLLIDRLIMGPQNVTVTVAAVVSITLFSTVICAKLIGCSLPILAQKLRLDPAVMASPFITTVVDAVSLVVYFSIAKMVLGI